MKTAWTYPVVDESKCIGCGDCTQVCPTLAIELNDVPEFDINKCRSCNTCAERCPSYAIIMTERDKPVTAHVDYRAYDQQQVDALCRKAKLHPDWIICYCTGTRAKEVVAAVLAGAKDAADVSIMTGARTGCSVECIQPILRILQAGGRVIDRAPGWQWYGVTITAWEIPVQVRQKHSGRGFHFDKDEELLTKVVKAP